MATFTLISEFNDEKALGSVTIDDDVVESLNGSQEFLEILPLVDPDGKIVFFSIMTSPLEVDYSE